MLHLNWVPGWIIEEFTLDEESNIPTWYTSAILLFAAALLAVITYARRVRRDTYVLHWAILTLTFLLLSLDEGASLHEHLGRLVQRVAAVGGFFYFGWVIPGMAIVLIFAIGYLKFMTHLPYHIMILFLLGAALYVGGAIGIELIGARYAEIYGERNLPYQLMTNFEETLEMLGVIVFGYGLIQYLAVYVQNVTLILGGQGREETRVTLEFTG